VNGWETVQCRYEDTSSCSKWLVVLHLQAKPRISTRCSVCLLAVCSQSALSPAPVSTCICPNGIAVHSYTHLPATPSACPLGANGIRRPGFPPQLLHPIKTILPQIETLPLRDGARLPPFRSSLIADPFTQMQRSHGEVIRNAHFSADKRLFCAYESTMPPLIET